MKKTNAGRILDKLKISYKLLQYEVDENDLSAENVAGKIQIPLEQVFKTLVLRGDKTGIIIACLPGGAELNLKSLAKLSGNKKVEMISMKEIQTITGYIRGGVSPIGMKKNYPTYIHESCVEFSAIMMSAGQRGLQILLSPKDLIAIIDATLGNIIVEDI